jgi:hypothetical protein
MILETLGGGLLGSIFGGLFRLAPEVLKWLDRKDERLHELKMFTLQTDLEKVRGEYRMEEKYVDFSKASVDAIGEAFKQQAKADSKAHKWVASVSALVRPGITWLLFGLYTTVKIVSICYAVNSGLPAMQIMQEVWTPDDFSMLMMILTFWFIGRSIEKREHRY